MAKKSGENRIIITLRSTESGHAYTTVKNKRNDPTRIELKKYDPVLRKHVTFKESK
jgi:large subunit ribosomal protein L33